MLLLYHLISANSAEVDKIYQVYKAHLDDLGIMVDWNEVHDGKTLLGLASFKGRTEIVRDILSQGADPNISQEMPAVHSTIVADASPAQLPILQLLVDHGAQLDICDKHGVNALHLAAYGQQGDICTWLLEQGVPLSTVTVAEQNALACAVIGARKTGERSPTVEVLLKAGANPADGSLLRLVLSKKMSKLDLLNQLLDENLSVNRDKPSLVELYLKNACNCDSDQFIATLKRLFGLFDYDQCPIASISKDVFRKQPRLFEFTSHLLTRGADPAECDWLSICVKKCPDYLPRTVEDLFNYFKSLPEDSPTKDRLEQYFKDAGNASPLVDFILAHFG